MRPKQLKIGDLHLYVQGSRERRPCCLNKASFFFKRECVTKIINLLNSIMALDVNTVIKKDPLLGKLSKEQIANNVGRF